MLKKTSLESLVAAGDICMAQQGYLRSQILLYIAESSLLCAEVHFGCCINRLFHIEKSREGCFKMRLPSLWPLGNYIVAFLPIDINRYV